MQPNTTRLGTEQAHPAHPDLDQYSAAELVRAFADDQQGAALAVLRAQDQLARAVDAVTARLRSGGRLVYLGAGTSGRLGVLDGVELIPTFSWPPERVVSLIAGGEGAMFRAAEGAEDDGAAAVADLRAAHLSASDVLIALAASGTTPYVLEGVRHARQVGALTVGVCNNPGSPLSLLAELPIELDTGPEVIGGSTRLKAGSAQKMALNTLSSSVMVRLHKVYGSSMVDLRVTNTKLRRRAVGLVARLTGTGEERAESLLDAADLQVKTAVVMGRCGTGAAEARALLARVEGDTGAAIRLGSG